MLGSDSIGSVSLMFVLLTSVSFIVSFSISVTFGEMTLFLSKMYCFSDSNGSYHSVQVSILAVSEIEGVVHVSSSKMYRETAVLLQSEITDLPSPTTVH